VCLPIAVGGTVLAERIIIALYEREFANSVPVLQIMLWALPSLFLLELLGRVANTLGLERPAARVNVINAVITVALNLLLVPTLGIQGAALALLGGRAIRLVQYWRLIGNERLVGGRWGKLARVALAATVMGAAVVLLGQADALGGVDSKAGLLMLISSGALVYAIALVALGGIDQREIKFMRNLALERLKRSSGA
jgi:O-antigen/teichoic acid export membrane protein